MLAVVSLLRLRAALSCVPPGSRHAARCLSTSPADNCPAAQLGRDDRRGGGPPGQRPTWPSWPARDRQHSASGHLPAATRWQRTARRPWPAGHSLLAP